MDFLRLRGRRRVRHWVSGDRGGDVLMIITLTLMECDFPNCGEKLLNKNQVQPLIEALNLGWKIVNTNGCDPKHFCPSHLATAIPTELKEWRIGNGGEAWEDVQRGCFTCHVLKDPISRPIIVEASTKELAEFTAKQIVDAVYFG